MENGTKHIQKLKIILLGDSGVGKTSLINQYVFKKFQHKAILDFQEVLSKQLEIDEKSALLRIRDTNGKERYGGAGLEAAFFSDAKGCMLVYDVNDPKSFDNLENWHNEFITRVISYQSDWKRFPFIVLGNKVDVDGGRNTEVYERALKWCQSKGQLQHLLTSAKDNKNVAEAFHYIAKLALNKEMINVILEPEPKHSMPIESFIPSLDAKILSSTKYNPQSHAPQSAKYNPQSHAPQSDDYAKNFEIAHTKKLQTGNPPNSQQNSPESSDKSECCTIM